MFSSFRLFCTRAHAHLSFTVASFAGGALGVTGNLSCFWQGDGTPLILPVERSGYQLALIQWGTLHCVPAFYHPLPTAHKTNRCAIYYQIDATKIVCTAALQGLERTSKITETSLLLLLLY